MCHHTGHHTVTQLNSSSCNNLSKKGSGKCSSTRQRLFGCRSKSNNWNKFKISPSISSLPQCHRMATQPGQPHHSGMMQHWMHFLVKHQRERHSSEMMWRYARSSGRLRKVYPPSSGTMLCSVLCLGEPREAQHSQAPMGGCMEAWISGMIVPWPAFLIPTGL